VHHFFERNMPLLPALTPLPLLHFHSPNGRKELLQEIGTKLILAGVWNEIPEAHQKTL
jgi:hypothetical protein